MTHPEGAPASPASRDPDGVVLTQRVGTSLVVTLNRPDRLNAVNADLYRGILGALRAAEADPGIRAVVLTGAGRAFCAGADLKAHGEGAPQGPERRHYIHLAQRANLRIQVGPVPVVAAVNGHAVGAGLELALSADFMLVAEDAKLRLPEIRLGTFVGGGAVYTLAERVGVLKARELIYFGDFLSGSEAAAMGLANCALPSDRVLDESLAWGERLAAGAPRSLAAAKRLVGRAGIRSRTRALRAEARVLESLMGSHDWAEGLAAFAEKRPPRFTGE
ncbi:MAG: enoyl-CoA hydratase/isomerase family protein [Gemmatimonadales bacterium]|nr:MAG: enoyl-CoA hydratase/isomerase family protein [Gemmatimonadales bacterium]